MNLHQDPNYTIPQELQKEIRELLQVIADIDPTQPVGSLEHRANLRILADLNTKYATALLRMQNKQQMPIDSSSDIRACADQKIMAARESLSTVTQTQGQAQAPTGSQDPSDNNFNDPPNTANQPRAETEADDLPTRPPPRRTQHPSGISNPFLRDSFASFNRPKNAPRSNPSSQDEHMSSSSIEDPDVRWNHDDKKQVRDITMNTGNGEKGSFLVPMDTSSNIDSDDITYGDSELGSSPPEPQGGIGDDPVAGMELVDED